MNPENQNPGGYQPQTPQQPQPGYPVAPQQPTPQVYGPQQYSPMPVPSSGAPGQVPPKNNKKLIIAVIVVAILLVATIVAAIFMNLKKGGDSGGHEIRHAYDSPVGLVPGMQASHVMSGKFKLRANYVTGGDFTKEGTFSVEDGHMYFDMVADDARVNDLMKTLYERRGSKIPFDAEKHGVNRNLTYGFASMLGHHYLYDQNGGELSGFIPAVETAKSAAKPDKLYTLTTACDTALSNVKKQTDMSTTNLIFERQEVGVNKLEAKVSFSTLQKIDKSVAMFFDSCFDLKQPSAAKLKKFVDGKRQDVTKSPTFTYWQENGANYLDVSAPANDTPFGGMLHFELTDLNAASTKRTGSSGSYTERRNQFGLAYSLCRVDPVVTTSIAAGYRFLREDPAYSYPSSADTGYYCTTLSVPPQFKPASPITLQTSTGVKVAITGQAVEGLRGHHDLVREVEQYNISNKRYPGPIEFRDQANSNMDTLTSVTQGAFADGSLVYTPSPADCVGTCDDFVLSYVPAPNVQIRRTTYRP